MAKSGTTIADVNLQVDGSGFERAMNRMIAQAEMLEKKLQKVGSTATASVDANIRKTIADLQKIQSGMTGLEKNANSKGFGRNEELKFRREVNALEAKGYTDSATAGRARLASEQQLRIAQQQFITAAVGERKAAREAIKTEELRLAAIKQQEIALRRLNAEREKESRGTAGPKLFGEAGASGVLARTAGYALAGAAIYGVASAAQSAIQFTTELEEKLAKLGAISGASGGQMVALSETILGVARDSAFSTSELVDASTTLAQAGFSVQGITDALGAASKLSLAAGTTMAEGVDVITSAIGAFQLQETEAARVADSLTAALNKSKLTIQQVALGIQYAGTTAFEQGVNFQELTSIMGAMAQAGIRSGSTIGTGLRQLLVDLQTPSEKLSTTLRSLGLDFKDIDVSTLGATQVFRNLAAAGFNSAEAYGSLETRAAAAYLVVKNNLPFVEEMQLAQSRTGTAAEAAAKATDTLNAQWQRQKNILGEGSSRVISTMTEALKGWLKAANDASTDEYINALRKQAAEADNTGKSLVDLARDGRVLAYAIAEHRLELADAAAITERYSEKLDENATFLANSSEAVSKQQTKMSALSQSIEGTIAKQAGLKDGSSALAVETISLASRFEGLAKYIDTSSNSVAGLISAMQQLRGEEALTLAGQLQNKQFDLAADVRTKSQKLGDLQDSFTKSKSYKDLPKLVKQAYDAFSKDPYNEIKAQAAGDAALTLPQGSAGRVKIGQNVGLARDISGGIRQAESVSVARGAGKVLARDDMQALAVKIDKLSSSSTTPKAVEAMLQDLTDKRNRSGITRGEQAAYDTLIQRAEALRGSKGSLTPVKEEKTTRESGMTATRNSIYDVQREVERMGGTIGERVGKNSGGHTGKGHPDGRAFDVSFQGGEDTDPKVKAKQNALALKYQKQGFTVLWDGKQYNGDGTTGKIPGKNQHTNHMHIEEPKGGAYSKNNAETNAADDEERRALQAAKRTAKLAVSNADKDLKGEIDELQYALSEQVLVANKEVVRTSFQAWEKALREQAEIDTAEMDVSELAEYNSELEEKITQKAEDTAEALTKGFLSLMKRTVEAAAVVTERAMASAEAEVLRLQGQLGGLDRASLNGKVPDYVRTLASRRIGVAEEQRDNTRMSVLPAEIATVSAAALKADQYIKDNKLTQSELAAAKTELEGMLTTLEGLRGELGALEAASSAGQLISTDVGTNVSQAIAAWQQLRGFQQSWAQTVGSEIAPALDFLEGSLNEMFNNLANGSRSLLQSFGDMAKGIIRYIQQLVIKIIASKIIELLMQLGMSALGGSTFSAPTGGGSAGYSGGSVVPGGVAPATLRFNGGPAVKGLMGGGRVTNGARGYDSVNAQLARDEFVVRSAAVKSVGVDFMNDLNKNGASAMKGMQSLAVLPTQGKQETNVYVVKPDTAPTMGPNDVLVAIHEDILRDGTTKKLIKHVASGG